MSVKSLIADPDFNKLSPEEKQGVLASVDPEFKNLGVNEIDQVINGIRSQNPKTSTNIPQQIFSQVEAAVKNSPMGMASSGINTVMEGMNKAFTPTIPVPDSVRNASEMALRPFRAAGVGTAEHLASMGTSPMNTTFQTLQALKKDYQPEGSIQKLGASIGESIPAIGASIISPNIGGPLAFMAQQAAQTGKVSPLPLLPGMAEGAIRGVNALRPKIVPALLKSTKGIPTEVSKMAMKDQGILDLPGTSESIQGKSQDIIDAIREASRKVGSEFGETYKKQGLPNMVDEIINGNTKYKSKFANRNYEAPGPDIQKTTSIPGGTINMGEPPGSLGLQGEKLLKIPGRTYTTSVEGPNKSFSTKEVSGTAPIKESPKNFQDLRSDYHSAISGDLFKNKDAVGAMNEISDQEKLIKLTDLKRSLQDKAIYPVPGQQLAPSEGAYNTAIQKMAANIDELRGKVPGGEKLAVADDAWAEMKEIKQRLISAFKDPYTGQDYLNRILKGNTDWLTSGRNAGRVGAIQRVEQITGKQVLQPALKEMAAAYINNPDSLSLPSFSLKSIFSNLVPTKSLLKNVGKIEGTKAVMPIESISEELKTITKELAYKFIKDALGNKKKARRMAKDAGYTWKGDY